MTETAPTLESALATAIEYETKVRDSYAHAAAATSDPAGKRVLEALASEEQGHLDYLTALQTELASSGTIQPKPLPTTLPDRAALADGLEQLDGKLDDDATTQRRIPDAEVEMLTRALEVERATNDFYKRMVAELPEGADLFEPFVAIEDGHLAIVQAELDHVRGMGFYFDIAEFRLEMA